MAADLAAWWERHAEALGPAALDGHIGRHPALAPTWQAAALAAEQVAGVPTGAWMTAAPEPGRRTRLALRLACWSQRGEHDQLVANIALIDGLLAPSGALRDYL